MKYSGVQEYQTYKCQVKSNQKSASQAAVNRTPDSNNIFLSLDVQFKPDLRASEIVKAVDEIETNIHRAHPGVGQIFIEVEGLKESRKNMVHRKCEEMDSSSLN